MRYATLKDIALKAGVSIPTVSRVLNNEKFVSKKVREKVKAAAKELNYEPEWTARSLRLRKTNIIGVIIPNIADYFFSGLVLGIEKYFRSKDKDIILFNTNNDSETEKKLIRLAISKRVEGIILVTIRKEAQDLKTMIERFGIPFVLVDNKVDLDNADFVLGDDIGGSVKIVEHLINVHRLKKIACISGPLDESGGYDKLEGYKKALTDHHIKINEDYIKIADWKIKKAYAATKEFFSLADRPQAIYCASTNMLIGCLRYLNENNIRIPQDIAIATFNDYGFVSALNPPVTTLARIDHDMGKVSAKMLFERMEGKTQPYRKAIINSELIIRSSCGCNGPLETLS